MIIFSLTSCISSANRNQDDLTKIMTANPSATDVLRSTKTPIPTIATRTTTPGSTAEATLQPLGPICEPPTRIDYNSEFSPSGTWITIGCKGIDEKVSSYLRVVNVENNKDWKINYGDYTKYEYLDRRGTFYPLHWSKDGKYLFVTSPSLGSGCCWIGSDVILVRLDLENGDRTEIANYEGVIPGGLSFSISPSDRYVLSTPGSDLKILDLTTWEEKIIAIRVRNGTAGYPLMSPNETKEYPKEDQGDLTSATIMLIDLKSGFQKRLLSGIDFDEAPVPISWQDDEYVLLGNYDTFWLLNIKTAKLTETEKP
ncbi:MAG: hypothetical protein HFACDABA_03183 [Anaerolineales bacterium]|nr:hypothetical protein [Anaerolineales bacterium]